MGNIIRTEYINILLNWKDKQFIKVLTGIRRSGKSTILSQYKDYLIKNFDIQQEQIIEYDFNNPNNQNVSYLELYNEITSKANGSATYYVFLDEIQEIKAWEKCVIGLFENKKIKFDVYVTGSNSKLLSTELSTLLTGRHKDIKVFPISFAEMIRYFTLQPDNFFYQYLCYGGLGITVNNYENQQDLQAILKDVFNDTINQDIKYRHGTKTHNQINKLIEYAYSNVGGTISIQKVPTLLKNTKQFSLSVRTIGYYLQWACDSLLLHKVEYYNPKGKSVLKTSSKYYAGDLGLLSTKIGFNSNTNTGFRMENTVLLQLLNFGYEVYTYKSKLGKEIDFVAIKNNKTFYIQVTAELNDENYKREVGNLLSIRDGWRKIVIFKNNNETVKNDGVVRKHIIDFLKEGL